MIDKSVDSIESALQGISSGASIFVSGFGGSGIPANLLKGLLEKKEINNITLINNNAGAGELSFLTLIRQGRVSKIICSYPRMPGNDIIAEKAHSGELEVEVVSQGTLVERIRAAGAGLGPFYVPVGYGTLLGKDKEQRIFDEIGYLLEMPLAADYAFIKAYKADKVGNVVYRYAQRNFGPVMAMAAKTTIVEVDHLVEAGDIDPSDVITPSVFVNRVVEANHATAY